MAYSNADIQKYLTDYGLWNPQTHEIYSPQAVYQAAANWGVTPDQLDQALYLNPGTSASYIEQQGWGGLSGTDTNESGEFTDQQINEYLTSSGIYDPATGEVDELALQQAGLRYGVSEEDYMRALGLGSDSGGGSPSTGGGSDVNPPTGGGTIDNATNYTTTTGEGTGVSAPNVDPRSSSLSPIFGPYTMDMLGQAQALSDLPYQPYEGQRYAEYDPLQNQAYEGLAGLDPFNLYKQAGEYGAKAQGIYDELGTAYDLSNPELVKKFMNPYTQNVTDVQKREAQRQYEIQNTSRDAAAVKAGAFGGSRQGIVQAEADRNLSQQLSDLQLKGDQQAYNEAIDAMLKARGARQQEATGFLNTAQGLGNLANNQLSQLLNAGNYKQSWAQKPLDFGYQQFQDSLAYPWTNVKNMSSMLQGLPLNIPSAAYNNQQGANPWSSALSGGLGAASLWNQIFGNTGAGSTTTMPTDFTNWSSGATFGGVDGAGSNGFSSTPDYLSGGIGGTYTEPNFGP